MKQTKPESLTTKRTDLQTSEHRTEKAALPITHLGCAGHLCVSSMCRWHRHTQIGDKYRVSTIGDYYPRESEKRATVGSGMRDYFETMVFETLPQTAAYSEECGCHELASLSEIDCERYATAGEAQVGHDRMVFKYAAMAVGTTA